MRRWRITVRGAAPRRVELRGYVDLPLVELEDLAATLKPYGLVMASPADDDYDPFAEART